MTWDDLCVEIARLLEPYGAPVPQGGLETVFCFSHDELAAAHPHLPQIARIGGNEGGCIDLWLTREDDRLVRVELEGMDLAQTLGELGLVQEARRFAAAVPGPLDTAAPAVASALALILAGSRTRPARH